MESVSSKIHELGAWSFFWKCSKLNLSLENGKKKDLENVFRFWDKLIWKCWYKLRLLRREYLSSALNELTKSPKILHITQRDFQRYLSSQGSINIVNVLSFRFEPYFARLSCYLSNNPLKGHILDIYLTTFCGVRKFKNTSAMAIIFFLKMFKIESKFRKCNMQSLKYGKWYAKS